MFWRGDVNLPSCISLQTVRLATNLRVHVSLRAWYESYVPHLAQVLYAVCAFQECKIVVRGIEEQSGCWDAVEVSTRKRSVVDELTVSGDCKT